MNQNLCNLLITVLSGVSVFILSQLFVEFALRPIQEYKKIKAKTAKLLVLYANYYSNPMLNTEAEKFPQWKIAANEIRELAAEVAAYAEVKLVQLLCCWLIPSTKKLKDASSHLIGLSNSFFSSSNGIDQIARNNSNYTKTVKKCMRIK